ncbi:MAG: DUF58 domain-containing protein [Chitinivibrionales bacterium]|nr:DUF58 domain-containing protein [Chitinivibrionales bacterium]MBD3396258.1 DUF58 domain-containing protein [Chitinivibrionales bacterium]
MIPREILQKVRRIEIKTQNIVNTILSGEYHSAFKGKGMEFSEVRAYVEGDDIRTIDWNVTARTGAPHIKKHVEERELTVMMVVDASASGNFGSVNQMKAEMAVELCAVLAFSAIRNNDRVGLIIFTSEVEKYVPPKKGKNHVLRVIRELLYFRPRKTGTNIGDACGFLNRVLRKRAVVFLVSDFIDAGFEAPLRITSRRHDCIAIRLTDPREREFRDVGLVELEDPEQGGTVLVDSRRRAFREFFRREVASRDAALRGMFRANRIDEIAVSTDTDYVDPLVRFFKRREKVMA